MMKKQNLNDNGFEWTCRQVHDAARAAGHVIFRGEHDLNLIGIRTADNSSNAFNDWMTVSHFRRDKTWAFYAFQCTTDPGLYWRQHPLNVDGTAIVVPGQYRGLWQRGKHRGKYEALVQVGPVKVWRDNNKDESLDFNGEPREGIFGINMHHASGTGRSTDVDKWSAGCQVLADIDDFNFLITVCRRQIARGYKTFSYTLLDDIAFL